MGMILRIASSRIVGQGDIVGRSGYFSLNLSANSVMRGRLDARRTLKSLVADLRGLTTWENAPDGKIVKPDVIIAKNYLNELELEDMGRLVNATLDMAERMAKRHIPMTMEDWAKRIDIILEAGDNAVLVDAGKITAEFAKSFAESEFEKYRVVQDKLFSSDFDRFDNNSLLSIDFNSDIE